MTSFATVSVPTNDMTHQNDHYNPTCDEDTDYQVSTSSAHARWDIPVALLPLVNFVTWQLEEQIFAGECLYFVQGKITCSYRTKTTTARNCTYIKS